MRSTRLACCNRARKSTSSFRYPDARRHERAGSRHPHSWTSSGPAVILTSGGTLQLEPGSALAALGRLSQNPTIRKRFSAASARRWASDAPFRLTPNSPCPHKMDGLLSCVERVGPMIDTERLMLIPARMDESESIHRPYTADVRGGGGRGSRRGSRSRNRDRPARLRGAQNGHARSRGNGGRGRSLICNGAVLRNGAEDCMPLLTRRTFLAAGAGAMVGARALVRGRSPLNRASCSTSRITI